MVQRNPSALSLAPLEGITGWLYRQIHRDMFPGLYRYYTPFFAPTADRADCQPSATHF